MRQPIQKQGKKMYRKTDDNNQPLCRFGPGGDFVTNWPAEKPEPAGEAENSLTKLLARLSEIINSLVGADLSEADTGFSGRMSFIKEGSRYEVKASAVEQPADTSPDATAKSDRRVPAEPMLFADDCGAGRSSKHSPKHRVRAHRRAKKKASSLSIAGQGTLFELNVQSA